MVTFELDNTWWSVSTWASHCLVTWCGPNWPFKCHKRTEQSRLVALNAVDICSIFDGYESCILVHYIPWSDENIWRYSVVSLLNDIQISWRHFSERNDQTRENLRFIYCSCLWKSNKPERTDASTARHPLRSEQAIGPPWTRSNFAMPITGHPEWKYEDALAQKGIVLYYRQLDWREKRVPLLQ